MNPRATLALLALTLLALGALYWLRQTVDPTREAAENRRVAAVFEPDEVREINITRGDDTVSLHRESAGWKLVSPTADRASPETVDRLLMAARFMEVRDRNMGRIAENFPESGLVPPRLRIELRGADDTVIDIGAGTALPQEVFARVSGERSVLRVADTIVALASAPSDSFRDPRLTEFTADDIEKFTVRRADGEMTLRRERGRWMIDKPVRAAADPRAVRAFLEPLLGLHIASFGAQGTDPEAVLPAQEAAISLTPRGGGEELELRVRESENSEAETLTAFFKERGGNIAVDRMADALFSVSPEKLRDRSLGYVDLDTVDRILLESNGVSVTLRRAGDDWVGEPDGRIRDAEQIRRLVSAFNETEIGGFRTAAGAEETGLDYPAQRISFQAWLSENTAEDIAGAHAIAAVEFGKAAPDGGIFARTVGGEETVTVPPALAETIRATVLPLEPVNSPR